MCLVSDAFRAYEIPYKLRDERVSHITRVELDWKNVDNGFI